ncbi:MAG: L-idonate 5-dehydrogenase, partial [Rhodospirillales bacterium]|nr:L-idonate 5-dehydrogenase [Rhodospirillales bacterium]
GICGSDLHYYHDGGFGTVRVREPMILGHEIAGEVIEIGSAVRTLAPGMRVAVNPSRPCGACRYCLEGQAQHCLEMRFYGSAMRMPHVQGGFREILVCEAAQAVVVPEGVSLQHAAFAEPLAVCLHAARQAGPLLGRRVLVTGTGPIGALAILVARHAGAREVVATDLVAEPLAVARRIGADLALNLREDPAGLERFAADKGYFDVVFEASGAGPALVGALHAARPGATIVQIGIGGETALPLNLVVAKEIALRGTFRFHEEFAWAVDFIASGAIDVAPLLSATVPIDDAVQGFNLASDRKKAMKVQIAL